MKALLVMNPGSRSGRSRKLWNIWESGLRKTGFEFDCVQTERLGHAFEITRDIQDRDIVVAVGGDGTINEVLDGVIQSANPHVRMGVLYSGISPDFCRFHGIPVDPQEALSALVAGNSKEVDVAQVIYCTSNGSRQVSHFGCSSNIGMGASVARYSNCIRKFAGDKLGTGVAVIGTLLLNCAIDLELDIDGKRCSLPKTNNLSVLKNPYIASGLKLNLKLKPDDGQMCIVGVHGKSRIGLCRTLPGFYSGTVTSAPDIFLKSCSRVSIHSRKPQEIEFDGDPRGFLPAEIEIKPRALKLIGGSNE